MWKLFRRGCRCQRAHLTGGAVARTERAALVVWVGGAEGLFRVLQSEDGGGDGGYGGARGGGGAGSTGFTSFALPDLWVAERGGGEARGNAWATDSGAACEKLLKNPIPKDEVGYLNQRLLVMVSAQVIQCVKSRDT